MKNKYLLLSALALFAIIISGCMHDKKEMEFQNQEMVKESMNQEMNKGMSNEMEVKKEVNEKMSYTDISAMEAKEMIDQNPGIVIIDVSPHYAKGHIPGSINYYLGDGSLDKAIPNLDKEKTYLVYCHVDSVSMAGAQKLIDAGFKNVYRLEGNYKAWVDAGYPTEK
jgi:rhodanese-related sulfurtransferase